jgi:hypothetical protein
MDTLYIEKTSKVIQTMYEDDEEEIDYEQEVINLFDRFKFGKQIKLNHENLKLFLKKFNVMYHAKIFQTFQKPSPLEYYCSELNYFLVIDFVLSFFRIDDKLFMIENVTNDLMFQFYVGLCEFFNFMHFLDVDDSFVNYLKYMITLYIIRLDRDTINTYFGSIMVILDEFFIYEIIKPLIAERFRDNGRIEILRERISNFDAVQNKYDKNVNYLCKENDFVNDIFNLYGDVKYHWVTVPCGPDEEYSDSDSDSDSDYNESDSVSESNSAPEVEIIPRQRTATKYLPMIEKSDPKYEEYFRLFNNRMYQVSYEELNSIMNNNNELCNLLVNGICSYNDIDLKNFLYDCDKHHTDKKIQQLLDLKIILNIMTDNDYEYINKNYSVYIDKAFTLCCEYGNLNVLKRLDVMNNFTKNRFVSRYDQAAEAASSPNRELTAYVFNYIDIDEFKNRYPDYSEPKIVFNYVNY